MFRTIFIIISGLGIYTYMLMTNNEKNWVDRAKNLYEYCNEQIKDMDLRVHVNKTYNDEPKQIEEKKVEIQKTRPKRMPKLHR